MLTGNIGFRKENAGVYRVHLNNSTHDDNIKYDISTVRELEKLIQYVNDKYNISKDIKSDWINFRIFKYFYWRINSSGDKQLESLRVILNELNNKYPDVCNELLKIIP